MADHTTGPPNAQTDHGHDHGAGGHSHGISSDADRRYLWTALLFLLAFMLTEVIVALLPGAVV
jgi:cobalt-zinc-cadmium efflux system protein